MPDSAEIDHAHDQTAQSVTFQWLHNLTKSRTAGVCTFHFIILLIAMNCNYFTPSEPPLMSSLSHRCPVNGLGDVLDNVDLQKMANILEKSRRFKSLKLPNGQRLKYICVICLE